MYSFFKIFSTVADNKVSPESNIDNTIQGIYSLKEGISISIFDGILILFLASIGGLFVRYTFSKYSNSFSSKSSFGNTIFLLTISVAALIAVVKSSLALSLGLVGALSVIRFRTAVKEPYNLAFLLFSICLGISIGASQFTFALLIALFGFLITVSTMIRLSKFNLSNSQVFSFEGFPSPANAVFIVSLPIFFDSDFFYNTYQYLNIYTLTIITFLSALIMNVNLRFIKISYDSSNKKNFFYSIVFLVLSAILMIIFMDASVTLIICAYVLISLTDQIISKLK